jgi:hypothetical protein
MTGVMCAALQICCFASDRVGPMCRHGEDRRTIEPSLPAPAMEFGEFMS